jgi:hypothetical protein
MGHLLHGCGSIQEKISVKQRRFSLSHRHAGGRRSERQVAAPPVPLLAPYVAVRDSSQGVYALPRCSGIQWREAKKQKKPA